ncbi:hypothetical protein C2E31_00040 [Rhodopirellula baltica]|nr:hypothetical protein C2E31_00040 [Rhodopirellula baltica]
METDRPQDIRSDRAPQSFGDQTLSNSPEQLKTCVKPFDTRSWLTSKSHFSVDSNFDRFFSLLRESFPCHSQSTHAWRRFSCLS